MSGAPSAPTIFGYKDLIPQADQAKTGEFTFLYRVPSSVELGLSSNNSLNDVKLGETAPQLYSLFKAQDEVVRSSLDNLRNLRKSAEELEKRSVTLANQGIRSVAIQAKELDAKIKALHGRFQLASYELGQFQTIVNGLKDQVPVHSQHYMPRIAFPSKGLQVLSKSLTEKLEGINATLDELIVFLEGSGEELTGAEARMTEYVDTIDELFYCVKLLHGRNRQLNEDLQAMKSRYFGQGWMRGAREGMNVEEEVRTGNAGVILSKIFGGANKG